MHSFIISGGEKTQRLTEISRRLSELSISQFDIHRLTPLNSGIGIGQVRELIKTLQLKPYSSNQVAAIIEDADSLTLEAQQALLKTLEEPPSGVIIFLETANSGNLLATILSRCQIINLNSDTIIDQNALLQCFKTLEQIITAKKVGAKIEMIDTLPGKREELISWLDLAIIGLRQELLSQKSTLNITKLQLVNLINKLLEAKQKINNNCQSKLVLDQVFLWTNWLDSGKIKLGQAK